MPLPMTNAAKIQNEPAFAALKTYLIDLTGLGYYRDKDEALAQRLHRRTRHLGLSGLAAYFEHITRPEGAAELDILIDEIAIGETYFFRDPAQFEALRETILPERIEGRKNDRALRIWSAGCATGAEPYSVAILLERHWPEILAAWHTTITGTDICGRRLEQARRASFSDWELRGLPDDLRAHCFTRNGKQWTLDPRYVRRVAFQQLNLKDILGGGSADWLGTYDIILCRNVLIYFEVDLMRRVLERLRESLTDGGWLLVGHAEPFLEIAHFLTPVTVSGATAYRRLDGNRPPTEIEQCLPGWDVGIAGAGKPTAIAPAPAPNQSVDLQPAPEVLDFFGAGPLAAQEFVPQEPIPRRSIEAKSPDDELDGVRRLADAGDWANATKACEIHLSQHPLNPDAHFILALILEHRGDAQGASDELQRVIYLDRSHALAHFHLGRMHALRNDPTAARRSFSNASQLLARVQPDTPIRGGDGLLSNELQSLVEQQIARIAI